MTPDPLARSLYAATANPWPAQPPLDGTTEADVCVVGGGFTGLSAALACAEAGLSVVLLEVETIGFGASGRNGGQLIPGLRWTMRDIADAFGQERARAIHDLVYTAPARVRDRIARHGIACDLKAGHLEAAWKPAHFDMMRRDADFLARHYDHDRLRIIQREDMADHIRTPLYHGALYDPDGGHFHPLNYALGLAKAALAAGVRIHEVSRVTAIDDSARVTARTAAGTVTASHAIIACDAWTGDVTPRLDGYTVPIMNYNIATAPLGTAGEALLPSDAAVADSRFVLNYFRLSADKRLIFGGGERYASRPPPDIAAFVRPFMARVFPSLAKTPIDFAWGGTVAVTANRLPHIGRTGNLFFAHGFSGHGALITTLAGELIGEAVRGTAGRFDILASLPHRRFPGGRLLRQPLAALGLLWFALRDRL